MTPRRTGHLTTLPSRVRWAAGAVRLTVREPADGLGRALVRAESLRRRWTYVNGTSRRRLTSLLEETGEIELFVHDSSHTERNLRFELERAWAAMRSGAVVADDIERNAAFGSFCRRLPDDAFLV